MVSKNPFTVNFTNLPRESAKMMELLRRVYEIIEMDHLNNQSRHKLSSNRGRAYPIAFSAPLGDDIFNYLQAKDQNFRDIVIKRQKRYRKRTKNKMNKGLR